MQQLFLAASCSELVVTLLETFEVRVTAIFISLGLGLKPSLMKHLTPTASGVVVSLTETFIGPSGLDHEDFARTQEIESQRVLEAEEERYQ